MVKSRRGPRGPLKPLHAVWAVVFVIFAALSTVLISMNRGGGETHLKTADAVPVSAAVARAATGSKRTTGSKTATVMAMATGYGLFPYRGFVGSLRKSGFEGKIILGVSAPMKPGVEEYLREQSVDFKVLEFVNCTFDPEGKNREAGRGHAVEQSTCAHPYSDIKLRWSRFPLLRDWLKECETCTGPVLVSDMRDTFFQLDPFGIGAPEVTGLQVFQEHRTQTTAHWITKVPIEQCKGMDFSKDPYEKPMLCSGTTIGTREAMLRYLGDMHAEMMVWMKDPKCCCNKMNGDDQSIHNYLYHTGKLPYATAIPNRMGIVNTAGVQGSMILNAHTKMWNDQGLTNAQSDRKPYFGAKGKNQWIGLEFDLTDEEGFFIDFDGGRSRVVHQFDRLGNPMFNYRNREKGKLWELMMQ